MELEAISGAQPDLVIADLSLGQADGLDLVRGISARHKGLPVLVLTMHEAPLYVRRAFAAGASGYVTKRDMTETLLEAIRSVLRGEKYGRPETESVATTGHAGYGRVSVRRGWTPGMGAMGNPPITKIRARP